MAKMEKTTKDPRAIQAIKHELIEEFMSYLEEKKGYNAKQLFYAKEVVEKSIKLECKLTIKTTMKELDSHIKQRIAHFAERSRLRELICVTCETSFKGTASTEQCGICWGKERGLDVKAKDWESGNQ